MLASLVARPARRAVRVLLRGTSTPRAPAPLLPQASHPLRRRSAVRGSMRRFVLRHLLASQAPELGRDLFAGHCDDRPCAVWVGALHKPSSLREPGVESDKSLGQQTAAAPPGLAHRAHVQVLFSEAVDLLDDLADPFHPPRQPSLLARDPLGSSFADRLPRVGEACYRCDRCHRCPHVADGESQCVDSGHTSIIPPKTARKA